ncbi:two-component regulator propeller domain-containing protein [Mariniflexile litorale]|uniref:histidine kinase n=1 Tax=Mariniflexile litorale TaxID=3045158 RepID=A0AAU7ECL0_9FLAO|nr:two-component regulator propeller domain-containing protein [Mariniflexile sp. KMM 9835]MDQ8213470.1 two-component regulator propeller domain-containing protein [Mariniflexile sp. KMM 9835]
MMNRKIIFFLLVLLSMQVHSQYQNLKFENLDTTEGLSSSTSTEIFQDSEGFMWFGTIDGLNRYDGYNFEIFRPILNDSTSISNNRISSIVEDSKGFLWVGTSNGLNFFDKKLEKFQRISLHNKSSNLVDQGEIINDLLYDEVTQTLWVATKNGVVRLNLENKSMPYKENISFSHYVNLSNNSQTIDNNDVTVIVKDKEGEIWAVTEGNYLNKYNPEDDTFIRVIIDIPNTYELNHIPKGVLVDNDGDFWIGNNLSMLVYWDRSKNEFSRVTPVKANIPIFHMYQDSKGIIWIATDGDGIYLYDKKGGLLQHIVHSPLNNFSLPNNQPSKIIEDKDGIFWIATYNKGISKLVLSKSAFGHYFYESDNSNGLSSKIAQSVLQDSKGRIWIGTDGGGLNLFNEKKNSFKHYRSNPNNKSSIGSNKIVYLLESFDTTIWVCTWDGGLSKFNPTSETAEQFKYEPNNPYSIGQNTVWCAVEDSKKRLWLGTQSEGLNLFDYRTKKFYKYKSIQGEKNNLISNLVFSIFIDSKNRLLIGTSLGLSVVELDKISDYIPSKIDFKELKEKPIQGTRVNYITEDYLGNIWIGTDIAMHHLDSDLKLIKSYSTADGLPNNLILGIAESNNNNLWITTKGGLSKFNIAEDRFYNYNVQDGVQGIEFQSKSIAKMDDGRILAGGINGFNLFDPNKIVEKPVNLKPIITRFKLFNEIIKPGQKLNNRVVLNESIANTNSVELKYDEGYLSFEFVAFHYENQKRVKYMYRMKGIHNDFMSAGDNREANYSSIPPGNYEFQVKASIDDQWDDLESSNIKVHILSPPWKTWWAYLLYLLFFVAILWFGMYYYTKMIKEEKEHELDQMKLQFFINVSHELRTPLTLILNPVDKIISSFNNPEAVKASAYTLQRSARRLYYLVNQLLDFRKMDLGKVPLKLVQGDLIKFSEDVFDLFKGLAKTKEIKYKFKSSFEKLPINFDPDKIEKIITNLISNAIKYTDEGGVVMLSISNPHENNKDLLSKVLNKKKFNEFVQIEIKDTGIGFKKEQLKDVFGRFVNAGNIKTGMGIGLNITQGLVKIHGGEIFVESKYKEGTVFTVLLPLNLKNENSELIDGANKYLNEFDLNSVQSTEYEIYNENKSIDEQNQNQNSDGKKKQVILVVEDNKELRKHLVYEFSNSFKIFEAVNGIDGLEKIKKHHPDLIISDVMMPKMDGFELCRLVKNEIEICHIPIILLTARSLEEDQIEGYNTGADEYLSKPFNINILRARVRNLLEAKKRLRDRFASIGGVLPSSEVTSNSLDEAFLDKATKAIIDNISDPDYKLDNLLNEIGIGRSQFYRKINSITGQNPSNFIRTIRLKYASELLLKNKFSIKEITHMAGFNSTAYFSKTFRELFGLTPTEYLEQKLKDSHK